MVPDNCYKGLIMFNLLLVTPDKNSLYDFASCLEKRSDVGLSWAESGNKALAILSTASIDLVVTDEELGDMSGLELAFRLLSVNPLINCVVLSSLSPEEYHEAGEGLGLMAQLPVQPDENQAEEILERLKGLKRLSAEMNIDRA